MQAKASVAPRRRERHGVRGTNADVAQADDDAYELRKLRAQLAVLREDLAKKSKSSHMVNDFHTLQRSSAGLWSIASLAPGLCRDANASTVFHISVGLRDGPPLASFLQTACPAAGTSEPLAISRAVLQAAELALGDSGGLRLTASVRVEMLNVPLDDVVSAWPRIISFCSPHLAHA